MYIRDYCHTVTLLHLGRTCNRQLAEILSKRDNGLESDLSLLSSMYFQMLSNHNQFDADAS